MRIVAGRRARPRAGFASLVVIFFVLSANAQAQPSRPAAPPPPAAPRPLAPPPATATPTPLPAPGSKAPATPPRARVAIRELQIDGEEVSPALGMQLQDGFVVGFVRAGIEVLDSVDVARRIEAHPELQKCDTPICLKRLGQVLDVRYLLLLRVSVNGNSYRMTARLFTTEGSTPAVLPVDTQSRFCDVCTAAEARDVMLRLADAIKRPIEEALAVAPTPPAPPPAKPALLPMIGLGAGLLAIVGGSLLVYSADSTDKTVPAIGGALMGGGLTVLGVSIHTMAIDPHRSRKPIAGLTVAWRW